MFLNKTILFTLYAICLIHIAFGQQDTYITDIISTSKDSLVTKNGITLEKQTLTAFLKMKEAAKKDGIIIQVVSGYRSYNRQKIIWNKKYDRYTKNGLAPKKAITKIINYSTIPGTSRHHWGTDIDIIDANVKSSGNVLVSAKFEKKGVFSKLKKWMDKNANSFGFYLVYTDNKNRKGFKYEPWHYSYAPVSKKYLKHFLNTDIHNALKHSHIKGALFFDHDFIENYIQQHLCDINPYLID